jgi:hypothetical protein
MNANLGILQGGLLQLPAPPVESMPSGVTETSTPPVNRFVEEQLLHLVHKVFCPGWPRPARQVVFCAIDDGPDVAGICRLTGEILARRISGNVGLIETRPNLDFAHRPSRHVWEWPGYWRSSEWQIGARLWRVPAQAVWSGERHAPVPDRLHNRLGELRLDFDFTLLQGPPAGTCSDALLLGQASDGVVLVVEAHRTRRAAAQRAKERLLAAQVRILGSVLSGRTFPIPKGIYEHL